MSIRIVILVFGSFFLVASCLNVDKPLEVSDYYAEGTADSNHLEKGLWKFYSLETHEICQQGFYNNGVRQGTWQYFSPINDSIVWVEYFNKDSSIRTNIPVNFNLDMDESNFVSFKQKDTTKFIILKIALAQIEGFDEVQYNKIMLQEVNSNSLKVYSNNYTTVMNTCNRKYHLNKFLGIDKAKRDYTLFTINGLLSDSLLVEVTVRCKTDEALFGEQVFFSVFSNLFVNGDRFFDENIDCEIIRNKKVSSSSRFSFSCNRPS